MVDPVNLALEYLSTRLSTHGLALLKLAVFAVFSVLPVIDRFRFARVGEGGEGSADLFFFSSILFGARLPNRAQIYLYNLKGVGIKDRIAE